MDKEYILKVVFAAGLLFVLFLWSGGIYQYNHVGQIGSGRINKFTNSIEIIEYDKRSRSYYWLDVTEPRPEY